jgi:hypothetical protein
LNFIGSTSGPLTMKLVYPAQGRRHHQVRKLRHNLGKKKHQGDRKDESDRYRDDVNAFVDWIGHRLGLSTSSKWR